MSVLEKRVPASQLPVLCLYPPSDNRQPNQKTKITIQKTDTLFAVIMNHIGVS